MEKEKNIVFHSVGEVFELSDSRRVRVCCCCYCDPCIFFEFSEKYGEECKATFEIEPCAMSFRPDKTSVVFVDEKKIEASY